MGDIKVVISLFLYLFIVLEVLFNFSLISTCSIFPQNTIQASPKLTIHSSNQIFHTSATHKKINSAKLTNESILKAWQWT